MSGKDWFMAKVSTVVDTSARKKEQIRPLEEFGHAPFVFEASMSADQN